MEFGVYYWLERSSQECVEDIVLGKKNIRVFGQNS